MNIIFNKAERSYLLRLVAADYQRMNANMDHAVSHGTEIMLPDFDVAANILIELENEKS